MDKESTYKKLAEQIVALKTENTLQKVNNEELQKEVARLKRRQLPFSLRPFEFEDMIKRKLAKAVKAREQLAARPLMARKPGRPRKYADGSDNIVTRDQVKARQAAESRRQHDMAAADEVVARWQLVYDEIARNRKQKLYPRKPIPAAKALEDEAAAARERIDARFKPKTGEGDAER